MPSNGAFRTIWAEINARLISEAIAALRRGDGKALGGLMTLAQREFDRYPIPDRPNCGNCWITHRSGPTFSAPRGWGPRGTAQLVARDEGGRREAIARIEADFPGMRGFPLTLKCDRRRGCRSGNKLSGN